MQAPSEEATVLEGVQAGRRDGLAEALGQAPGLPAGSGPIHGAPRPAQEDAVTVVDDLL